MTNAPRPKDRCRTGSRIHLQGIDLSISIMSAELRMYRAYASFVKRFLFIGGICPNTRRQNVVYRYIVLWILICCFITLFGVGNCCKENVTNISLLTASLNLFSTLLNVTMKTCCFSIHHKKLRHADGILDSLLEEALRGARARTAILFSLRTFYRLIYTQTSIMTVITIILWTGPLITMKLHAAKNSTTGLYRFPSGAVFPWTVDSTLVWQVHYIFETSMCWFTLSISTGVDAFFGFCMFRISALLRSLAIEFEGQLSRGGENGANERKLFRKCVDKHNSLIECRDIVQTVYGPTILLVTVTNAVGMCSLIFQTFQVSGISAGKVAEFGMYLFMKLLQTFQYAWPGELIVTESEFLRREVYSNVWYECCDTSFAKQFQLVLVQRAIILKACDLFQVSLDLFSKILNTTISYYFLLETLNSDKE